MKILWGDKDGGKESRVWVWGIESKHVGSVLLMLFREGSREAFHSHAFNALSWVLRGKLRETFFIAGAAPRIHVPSWKPIKTYRETFHMVEGLAPRTLVFSLRGPWVDTWREFLPRLKQFVTLTHGRKEVYALS